MFENDADNKKKKDLFEQVEQYMNNKNGNSLENIVSDVFNGNYSFTKFTLK
jgi:hypothetical protein